MANHIEANKEGVVTARLVNDGAPVEYDEPLFTIA
ncbi:biotin/lipoyl-containing protein [Streptomyces sp. NPDC085944]